jgi:hypothetical protein
MSSRSTAGRAVGLAGVLLLVAALLGPSMALAADGNSANAKLCQKGGWATLVRSDGTAFASQSDCVSYGAIGGTLYQAATIHQTLHYAPVRIDWPHPLWLAFVAGSGFTPGAQITFTVTFGITDPANQNRLTAPLFYADATGAVDTWPIYLNTDSQGMIYLSCSPQTIRVTATDGTHIGAYTANIPACPA